MFATCAMPTSAKPAVALVDTSVAIALLVSDHEAHEQTFQALVERRLGLAGHAAFEAFSVLTRLPAPARPTRAAAHQLLASNFPETRFLSAGAAGALLGTLAERGISGGAVYDALVGATALEHGLALLSRDRRALGTYRALGVLVELLP